MKDKYDPAFWPQDEEELNKDLSEEEMDTFLLIDDEYEPKDRPICAECGNPYVCTHNVCEVCLICERKRQHAEIFKKQQR